MLVCSHEVQFQPVSLGCLCDVTADSEDLYHSPWRGLLGSTSHLLRRRVLSPVRCVDRVALATACLCHRSCRRRKAVADISASSAVSCLCLDFLMMWQEKQTCKDRRKKSSEQRAVMLCLLHFLCADPSDCVCTCVITVCSNVINYKTVWKKGEKSQSADPHSHHWIIQMWCKYERVMLSVKGKDRNFVFMYTKLFRLNYR